MKRSLLIKTIKLGIVPFVIFSTQLVYSEESITPMRQSASTEELDSKRKAEIILKFEPPSQKQIENAKSEFQYTMADVAAGAEYALFDYFPSKDKSRPEVRKALNPYEQSKLYKKIIENQEKFAIDGQNFDEIFVDEAYEELVELTKELAELKAVTPAGNAGPGSQINPEPMPTGDQTDAGATGSGGEIRPEASPTEEQKAEAQALPKKAEAKKQEEERLAKEKDTGATGPGSEINPEPMPTEGQADTGATGSGGEIRPEAAPTEEQKAEAEALAKKAEAKKQEEERLAKEKDTGATGSGGEIRPEAAPTEEQKAEAEALAKKAEAKKQEEERLAKEKDTAATGPGSEINPEPMPTEGQADTGATGSGGEIRPEAAPTEEQKAEAEALAKKAEAKKQEEERLAKEKDTAATGPGSEINPEPMPTEGQADTGATGSGGEIRPEAAPTEEQKAEAEALAKKAEAKKQEEERLAKEKDTGATGSGGGKKPEPMPTGDQTDAGATEPSDNENKLGEEEEEEARQAEEDKKRDEAAAKKQEEERLAKEKDADELARQAELAQQIELAARMADDNRDIDDLTSVALTAAPQAPAAINLAARTSVAALQGKGGALTSLSQGHLIIDNVSPTELVAATNIRNYNPSITGDQRVWHTFVDVSGLKGKWKDHGKIAGHSFNSYGLNVGAFKELNSNWLAGVMLGSHKTKAKATSDANKINIDTIVAGPFAAWAYNNWQIDAALTMSQNTYSLSRQDILGKSLHADFKGTDLAAHMGISYEISLDNIAIGLTVTPGLQFQYVNSDFEDYKEKGNSPSALKVSGKSNYQTVSRLGVDFDYLLPNLEEPTSIGVSFGMQKQSVGDYDSTYKYQKTTSDSTADKAFTSNAIDDTGFTYGVSLTRLMSASLTFSFDYTGTKGQHSSSQGVTFSLEKKF